MFKGATQKELKEWKFCMLRFCRHQRCNSERIERHDRAGAAAVPAPFQGATQKELKDPSTAFAALPIRLSLGATQKELKVDLGWVYFVIVLLVQLRKN